MSENDDLRLAKLEAAGQIVSAFAQGLRLSMPPTTEEREGIGDYLATVFRAVWRAIDESVGE